MSFTASKIRRKVCARWWKSASPTGRTADPRGVFSVAPFQSHFSPISVPLPSPTFWGSFFGKSLDRALSFCFISTDERRSSSQGAKATSPRTARSDRDPARFAIGSPDLPSPRLPEVPPGRRPPGLGPHGGLSRRTDAPVHGSRRTQGAGPAVAAKLSKVAGQVGSDLRAQSRIVRSRPLGYFFELVLFHH